MDKSKIKEELTKEIPNSKIFIDEPMKKHTSFKVGGMADIFVKVHSLTELIYIIDIAKKENIPIIVIGNGSNILVKDNGIRGIVLKIEFNDIYINEDVAIVGAGMKLGELAQRFLKENLSGFEFASGIPGTIGRSSKNECRCLWQRNERCCYRNQMS